MNPTIEKRRALGRGLESLLPSSASPNRGIPAAIAASAAAAAPQSEDAVQEIAVELIGRAGGAGRLHRSYGRCTAHRGAAGCPWPLPVDSG